MLVRASLVMVLLGVWALPCQAESKAEKLFKQGRSLFERGEYPQALISIQSAYDLTPHPQLLYNIGLCQEKLNHPLEAIKAFREYLRQAPEAGDRASVEARIVSLERGLPATVAVDLSPREARVMVDGRAMACQSPCTLEMVPGSHVLRVELEGYRPRDVEVQAEPLGKVNLILVLDRAAGGDEAARVAFITDHQGAQVQVDGQLVGVTPLAPVKVAAGQHTLTVEAKGHLAWTKTVTLEANKTLDVAVTLLPQPSSSGTKVAAWVTAGTAGAAAIAGAILGGLTLGQASSIEDDISRGNATWADVKGGYASGQAYEAGSIILLSTAVAAAIASTVLFVVSYRDGQGKGAAPEPPLARSPLPSLSF